MAAGAFTLYNQSKAWFFDGTFDWANDTHYAHLFDATYTPALTHDTFVDLGAATNEVTDGDYAVELMITEAVNGGTATATGNCDAANLTYGTNVTITARYAIIRTGTATAQTTDRLVGYVELETASDVSSTNGTFEVQWAGAGLWTFA